MEKASPRRWVSRRVRLCGSCNVVRRRGVDLHAGIWLGHGAQGRRPMAGVTELTAAEIRALDETLDDEYRAWATYDQVIVDFGEVRPFTNIRAAESRHIEALQALFARYGLAVPANPWPGKVERYASLQAACAAGVAAEIANGEMYARLLSSTRRPDILRVFQRLKEASQQRHLPAFQRCVQRGAGGAGGRAARPR